MWKEAIEETWKKGVEKKKKDIMYNLKRKGTGRLRPRTLMTDFPSY